MKDRKKYVAVSSFINGMGSILDVSPLQLNETMMKFSFKSDVEALSSDWEKIGKDLGNSLKNYGDSIKGRTIEDYRG